jgi:hypothetical protein
MLTFLEKFREAKTLLQWIEARVPQYGPLVRADVREFRNEFVKATVGAVISGAAGLIFSCFFSVAVIISAWPGPHREAIAWVVCAVWGAMAIAGLVLLRRVLSGPVPFRLVSHKAASDYANLIVALEREVNSRS